MKTCIYIRKRREIKTDIKKQKDCERKGTQVRERYVKIPFEKNGYELQIDSRTMVNNKSAFYMQPSDRNNNRPMQS